MKMKTLWMTSQIWAHISCLSVSQENQSYAKLMDKKDSQGTRTTTFHLQCLAQVLNVLLPWTPTPQFPQRKHHLCLRMIMQRTALSSSLSLKTMTRLMSIPSPRCINETNRELMSMMKASMFQLKRMRRANIQTQLLPIEARKFNPVVPLMMRAHQLRARSALQDMLSPRTREAGLHYLSSLD